MTMLIQGPKQLENDIQLYLGLLKEELATLCDAPPNMWDTVTQDYFHMRAVLVMTVHILYLFYTICIALSYILLVFLYTAL
jgi:hypothetical protein